MLKHGWNLLDWVDRRKDGRTDGVERGGEEGQPELQHDVYANRGRAVYLHSEANKNLTHF